MNRLFVGLLLCLSNLVLGGCEDTGKKSAQLAPKHVEFLASAAKQDVQEVRAGLPKGAKVLEEVFIEAHPELPSAQAAREALVEARSSEADLRVAKSTFFLVAGPSGRIIRNDQEADEMAGEDLFEFFPGLRRVKSEGYVEARGSMKQAAGVRGRDDAQWVAAAPIQGKGELLGVYATGWSWSAYAYRLETAIRSEILSNTASGDKVPLIYVYVIVGEDAYGAPVAPMVNAEAIMKLDPLAKLEGAKVFSRPIEIDRRSFGVAIKAVPALGEDVAIAVLRSET